MLDKIYVKSNLSTFRDKVGTRWVEKEVWIFSLSTSFIRVTGSGEGDLIFVKDFFGFSLQSVVVSFYSVPFFLKGHISQHLYSFPRRLWWRRDFFVATIDIKLNEFFLKDELTFRFWTKLDLECSFLSDVMFLLFVSVTFFFGISKAREDLRLW